MRPRDSLQKKMFFAKQRGTVLITVLLVVAFVVILIVEVRKTVAYQAQLNRNLMHRDQAYSYLIGMEELAKIYLKKAFESEKEETVHLGQAWAQDDIVFPIDGGGMTASITDMQSCFNLNSLGILDRGGNSAANPQPTNPRQLTLNPIPKTPAPSPTGNSPVTASEEIFITLLEKILENTESQPSALAAAVKDWIDEDSTPTGPDGVEDIYYQGLEVPYLPPNGPIAHVSELRTIKSFDNSSYTKMRDYICVLPDGQDNKLNVNTIPSERAELLYAALGGKVPQNQVNKIISERPEKGYEMQDFWGKVGSVQIKDILKERLDVTSIYFKMDAKAEINRTKVYMKTLFVREDDNNFKVVSRYFGKE
jgi:general secretion pathway protein K